MKQQTTRRAAAKRKSAVTHSRYLHVTHPRHTGRLRPHSHTSYPALGMILLLVGVFLAGWNLFVNADPADVTVHASVQGTAPSTAATIDAPTDGKVFSEQPITVSGTCPNQSYENLYRNGVFSGVANCTNGTYSIQTSLFSGVNELKVRDFSTTDEGGPWSNAVSVTYQIPVSNTAPSKSETTNTISLNKTTDESQPLVLTPKAAAAETASPLLIKSNFTYQGYYTNETTNWPIDLEGGVGPYAVVADWGDGQQTTTTASQAGVISLQHTYTKAANGNYVVKFTVTDANGMQTVLQMIAIINDPPALVSASQGTTAGTPTNNDSTSGDSSYLQPLMKYVVPTYGAATLMTASFWLGSHAQLAHAATHLRPRYKRPHRF